MTVAYSAFQPQSESSRDCIFDPLTARVEGTLNVGVCCLVAPLRIPDGATVTGFSVYLRKEGASDLSMQLRRKRRGTITPSEVMASVSSSGFPASSAVRVPVDLSITQPAIDNGLFSYFLGTDDCLDDGTNEVYSATVFFD